MAAKIRTKSESHARRDYGESKTSCKNRARVERVASKKAAGKARRAVSAKEVADQAPGAQPTHRSVTQSRAKELGRVRCGGLYLDADLLERAGALAAREGVSRNDVVNEAMRAHLEASGA